MQTAHHGGFHEDGDPLGHHDAESAFCFSAANIKASAPPRARASRPRVVASAATASGKAGGVNARSVLVANDLVVPDGQLSTIFIPIAGIDAKTGAACPGSAKPQATVGQVRRAVFQELNRNGTTVGSTFNRCSYGKNRMTMNNSLVADTVNLPCSGVTNGIFWNFATCNFDDFSGWADAADEILRAKGVELENFKYKVYLVPPGACTFVGLGYIGCDGSFECRSWIGGDYWTSPATIGHELGHNNYLAHSGAYTKEGWFDEYADDTGMMGFCCSNRCPNIAHAWQMGWATVQQFNSSSLPPGEAQTVQLASQSLSARSGVRIQIDWQPDVEPIFLGYRTRAGGDAQLHASLARKVHIYSSLIQTGFDAFGTTYITTLAAGQKWEHPTAGLVVQVRNTTASAGNVSICRQPGC